VVHSAPIAQEDLAFSGLITCGHCGCAMVGEIKKRRYVYYHCTGYGGKCPEPYTREEVLEREFAAVLDRLAFDDEVLDWVREALRESHADERREHDAAVARLHDEYNRLQGRIDAMYVDKLDGRIDAGFFDRMAAQWRDEQARCLRDIERHQGANQSYLDEGIHLLRCPALGRQPQPTPASSRRSAVACGAVTSRQTQSRAWLTVARDRRGRPRISAW